LKRLGLVAPSSSSLAEVGRLEALVGRKAPNELVERAGESTLAAVGSGNQHHR
jgi:hypothetical protein